MTEQQHPADDPGSVNPSALTWAARGDSLIEWPPEPATREAAVSHVEPAGRPDPAVLDDVRALVDAPPLTAPQAQGDVFVLPWLDTTTPAMRAERVDAAGLVTSGGVAVTADGSHVLLDENLRPDGAGPRIRYADVGKGHTLGTLVVEPGAVARLSHREHGDLLIGPGVYVLHQQRRWTPTGQRAVAD